jgi:hypothetical protein
VNCENLQQNACRGNCDAHKYCLYNGGTGACECVSNDGQVGLRQQIGGRIALA